jgi:sporulation protein YlmC with PRC-barrel domain
MRKLSILMIAAALAGPLAMPVMAQTQTGTTAQATAQHLMRASKLVGMHVYNEQNQDLGPIIDILVNDQTGTATAVLSVGAFVGGGTKLVEVPVTHVKMENTKAMMPSATKAMMAAMAPFNNPILAGCCG